MAQTIPGVAWPGLPLTAWSDTYATLHLWTQIVGKIRLAQTPWTNHSWHVTLYVTPRGLTTGSIPYGTRAFQIDFDFIAHELKIHCDDGRAARFPLEPQSVAVFYRRVREEMKKLDLEVKIYPKPNEVANAVPFDQDEVHASYDLEYADRFWRVLLQSDRIFKKFRARFVGKCSPVHFFWGAPDLAVTRFSGRLAPLHPGGVPNLPDRIAREATRTRSAAADFGPAAAPSRIPLTIPTLIRSRKVFPKPQSSPRPRSTARISGNSFCRTTRSVMHNPRKTSFSNFCRQRTKPRPT
jgi:uncharacterized protein DUF5996